MYLYDWQTDVQIWTRKRRSVTPELTSATINFFRRAFEHTVYPDRSWFGVHDNTISLVVGNIFLAAIISSGNSKGVWMLVNQEPVQTRGWFFYPTRSTQDSITPLYWGHAKQWQDIAHIEQDSTIWINYAHASQNIFNAKRISGDRDEVQIKRGKRRLSDFWNTSSFVNTLVNPVSVQTKKESASPTSFGYFPSEEDFEEKIMIPLMQTFNVAIERQYLCRIVLGTKEHFGKVDLMISDHVGRISLIENKLRISNDSDLYYAREQAKSYALFEGLTSFVVASPQGIWVYSLRRGKETLEKCFDPTEITVDPGNFMQLLLRLR